MLSGSLETTPFPAVLAQTMEENSSGTLLVSRDVAAKKIYFADKHIFFIESTEVNEQLPQYLQSKSILTKEALDYVNEVNKNIYLFPSTILDLQIIDENVLLQEMKDYLKILIAPVFQWREGYFYFQPLVEGQTPPILIQLPVYQFIVEGCRSIKDIHLLHRIFPDYQEKPNLNEGSWGRLMLIQPNPQESFILSRIDGELTVEDLLSICPFAEEDILASLFAFQSCNIITMQKAVGKLFRLGVEVAEMFSGKEIPLAQTSDEFFELFAELEDKYKEIIKGDYYDVLDVQQNASLSQIKSSYYQLAKKFHPDRYSTLTDAAAREKLSFVFSKITEAYQILEGNREAYDNKLKEAKVPKMKYDEAKVEHEVVSEKKEFVKDHDRAEKLLERGKMEFILGHYLEGIRLFREAYINDPDSPMVLRILGKNVARYPQWRKEAEDYLNKAVGMEPTNAENYYELGCLYQKFGFYYKARSKFWIALKYDPYNKETLNALASLPLDVKFPEEQKKDIFAKIKDKLSKLLGR